MSKRSDKYEQHAVEYLIQEGIDAQWLGGSNANQQDISINNGESFIEVKMRSAQGAQFLAKKVDGEFKFSSEGESGDSQQIIDLMNENKSIFSSKGNYVVTDDEDVCFRAIKKHYSSKGVAKFMTKNKKGRWMITDIEDLKKNYSFSAIYRNKKSGSRCLPKSEDNIFEFEVDRQGKRAYCTDESLKNKYIGDHHWINESLEIRKLSNRSDSCVVFQIKFKF